MEVDKKRAIHNWELAAMGGNCYARHNLGCKEEVEGSMDRALKHFMIAAEGGYTGSLQKINNLYSSGHATKDDYTKVLQAYQEYLGEVKSVQRDEAAAYKEDYKYLD